jgi:hypothetical protein
MDWKQKTCEGCKFRVEMECRRFPPQRLHSLRGFGDGTVSNAYHPRYILVVQSGHHDETKNGKFIDACAEYSKQKKCTCHERDSSQVCSYCYDQGERGHMQRETDTQCWGNSNG